MKILTVSFANWRPGQILIKDKKKETGEFADQRDIPSTESERPDIRVNSLHQEIAVLIYISVWIE